MIRTTRLYTAALLLLLPALLPAQSRLPQVLTNQVGYEASKPKRAVVVAESRLSLSSFQLIDEGTGKTVYQG